MPALAYHFHLMPWQLELLTLPEIEAFLMALQDLNKPPKG